MRSLAVVVAALALLPFAQNARAADPTPIVPSLTPAATDKLWHELVRHARSFAPLQASCRPLRAIFYSQTDWLRLATRLAAQPSPCAQYYVSVPPLAAAKTTLRNGEAAKIRALGPSFHALAEIHYSGWSQWVASNGATWFDAGVEARKRMEASGFDVSEGDTWAVNELSSAVRVGTGNARQNIRDLVRGLATGSGGTPVKGVAWTVGIGQPVGDTTLYQTNLQNWLGDTAFWTDMAAYVSDWSQEVYADWRKTAVPGTTAQQRRDYLNDYLQAEHVLARVAPPTVEPARTYIQSAYAPLASAAWSWDTGYGWSAIPYDQMQSFVSLQVYALRAYSVSLGQPQDHWGFAWAPRNVGLSAADFASQSGLILDRMAAAIRDSAAVSNPADPGIEACTNTCGSEYPGGSFTEVWKSFRTWTQPLLSFTSAPQTIAAGTPSGPMSLALLNATGAVQAAQAPIAVTLSSSSVRGQFSLAPTGPWTPTLAFLIPQGGSAAGPFYYLDTRAGSNTITAAAAGVTSGTQAVTVLPGAAISLKVQAIPRAVPAGESATLTALGTDQYGNAFPIPAAWSVDPPGLGRLSPRTGSSVQFDAGARGGKGTVTATAAGLAATAALTVGPGPLEVASIRYGIGAAKTLLVTVSLVNLSGRPVRDAFVSVVVRRRGYPYFVGHKATGTNGRATFRVNKKPGCYRTTVTRVNANGYRWDRATPVNTFCK